MRLKIVAPTVASRGTKVFLDGMELRQVIGVKVEMDADDTNRATISFYPSETDIEGEFLVERKVASQPESPKEVEHA